VTSLSTTHATRPRPSWPRGRHRRGARAAALSLALTVAAGSGLAATPAWAADGYHITATIHVGGSAYWVAVSPDGTRAYVTDAFSGLSVINTTTNHITASIHGLCDPLGVAVGPGGTHIYVASGMDPGVLSVITRG
jgi:YVTN family beta-propeller protein